MEYLEKPTWNEDALQFLEPLHTRADLARLTIDAPNKAVYQKVMENWDKVAKPLDGMGKFEHIIANIGAIIGTDQIQLSKKAVIIMCADNGIVAEKISQSGQEVTFAVAQNMAKKQSSVGKMASVVGADTIPVDIGINSELEIQGLLQKKIRCGTRNFLEEPAMTEEETIRAIGVGIDIVADCKNAGYQILATGEMGIGNTTTSSAVTAALLNCAAAEVTGRGAGLDNEGLLRKQKVITKAVKQYGLQNADALRVLETVGGLDIAGLVGVCIGGALFHVPIVLDGVISLAAALLAERIASGTKHYLIASHKGKEPAMERLMKELGLEAVIDGNLALGEGTGAVMMLSLLEIALRVYRDGATFSDIQISQYERLK